MTRIRIDPSDSSLGASVSGVPLSQVDDASFAEIYAAFLRFGVLVFPGQHLSAEEQVAFGRRFGEIEHLYGDSGWVPISNQRRDGSLLPDDSEPMQIMRGNEGWHTDSSYMPLAAKASLLAAEVVPGSGGETEWADMRAAYDALDVPTRERIADLAAHHSLRYSQEQIGHSGGRGYGFHDGPAPLRPLVKRHPETGRVALYIGRHAHAIPGLPEPDSAALLRRLLDEACRPPRVWTHRWQPGDLAVWDNRCVLHRARPYDHRHARVMRHTRVAGDPATEAAV